MTTAVATVAAGKLEGADEITAALWNFAIVVERGREENRRNYGVLVYTVMVLGNCSMVEAH